MKARVPLIALSFVALCAWLWVHRDDAPAMTHLPDVAIPEQARPASLDPLESGPDHSGRARVEAEPEAARSLAATIPARVLDRAGTPVAGVALYALEWPGGESDKYAFDQRERGAKCDQVEQQGRGTCTDGNGESRIARAKSCASVFASHAGCWALQDYLPEDERVVLTLAPERSVDVHVHALDGGDAQGVDVVLRSLDFFGLQLHATSDAQGVARFRRLQPFFRRDVAEPCAVDACGLFEFVPELRFESLESLPARIELGLPACGALEIELTSKSGTTVETETAFQLVRNDTRMDDYLFGLVNRTSANGRVRLEWVGVRSLFGAAASTQGGLSASRRFVEGPASAGEVVAVSLQARAPPAAIYRAVDEQGGVFASRTFRYVVCDSDHHFDSQPWAATETRSDEAGHVRLPLMTDEMGGSFVRTIDVATTRAEDGSELWFRARHWDGGAGSDVECGDAFFRPARRIVSGRVLDERGVPRAGARVRATEDATDDWEELLGWCVSGDDGAFEARAALDGARVRVIAEPGTPFESASTVVDFGASGVVLTIGREGSLEGSLLLPDGLIGPDVCVEWTPSSAADQSAKRIECASAGAEPHLARFRLGELRAENGSVRVLSGGLELARFDDVLVAAGAPTRDSRLQRIDLRGGWRRFCLFVDDPAGMPARAGVVRIARTSAAPDEPRGTWNIARGVAICFVPAGPLDLRIDVPDARRATRFAVVENELRVRLVPPFEVMLELHGARLPEVRSASLFARGEQRVFATLQPAREDAAIFLALLPIAGRWKLGVDCAGSVAGPWDIEVADTELSQLLVLDLDAPAAEAAQH